MKRRREETGGGERPSRSRRAPSSDLVRLDRDLRALAIEERCSFGSELRAELAAEYARLRSSGSSTARGARMGLLAAAVAALLLLGVWLVPPARASLARLLQSAPQAEPAVVASPPAVSPPALPVVIGGEETPLRVEPLLETALEPPPPGPPLDGTPDGPPPPPPTLPSLLDRERARGIVTDEYPVALQERGVGGVTRVLVWVCSEGMPETPTVRISSGVPELDQAALRATRAFRFVPATRAGESVGTWVEFSIRFQPDAGGSQPDPEYQAFEIPLVNQ